MSELELNDLIEAQLAGACDRDDVHMAIQAFESLEEMRQARQPFWNLSYPCYRDNVSRKPLSGGYLKSRSCSRNCGEAYFLTRLPRLPAVYQNLWSALGVGPTQAKTDYVDEMSNYGRSQTARCSPANTLRKEKPALRLGFQQTDLIGGLTHEATQRLGTVVHEKFWLSLERKWISGIPRGPAKIP